jgi:hypothetical protein
MLGRSNTISSAQSRHKAIIGSENSGFFVNHKIKEILNLSGFHDAEIVAVSNYKNNYEVLSLMSKSSSGHNGKLRIMFSHFYASDFSN